MYISRDRYKKMSIHIFISKMKARTQTIKPIKIQTEYCYHSTVQTENSPP